MLARYRRFYFLYEKAFVLWFLVYIRYYSFVLLNEMVNEFIINLMFVTLRVHDQSTYFTYVHYLTNKKTNGKQNRMITKDFIWPRSIRYPLLGKKWNIIKKYYNSDKFFAVKGSNLFCTDLILRVVELLNVIFCFSPIYL